MNKAIALSYPKGAEAPFIVASGTGALAERIIEIAKENDVYIVQEGQTADILSLYEVGSYIPAETYEAVAGIFAFLNRIQNGKD